MARKHLFVSLDEMQKFYPFQRSDDFFEDLTPTLKLVELKYLLTDIDTDTWAQILTEIDTAAEVSGSFTNESWEELAARVQQAAAYLTALYHMAKANVIFGPTGLLVARLEQAVPASEARTKELKYQLLKDVQTSLDLVIEYLESNTAVFTSWAASDKRLDLNNAIIRTAKEFDNSYTISENRYMFRKLLAVQKRVIATEIRAHIGTGFLTAYIADLNAGLSPENIEIQPTLNRAIAYLTMADALPRLQLQLGPEGIAIFDSEYAALGARRDSGDLTRLKFLVDDAKSKGLSEIMDLKYTLDAKASATVYPDYFNSASYENPDIDHTDLNDYGDDHSPQNHWAL